MRTQKSRLDELKQLIELLARDILRHLKQDDVNTANVMMLQWNVLIHELIALYANEPVALKDYIRQLKDYEVEMQTMLREMQHRILSAMANVNRMKENLGVD